MKLKHLLRTALAATTLMLWSFGGWGQTAFTATYTFGADGNVASFAYNGTTYDGITPGNILKIGVTTSSSSGNFRATDWPLDPGTIGDLDGIVDLGKYIGFTIEAATDYKFTVTSITFGVGRSATGIRQSQWRGSDDTYGSILNNYTTLNAGLTNSDGVLTNPDANSSWTNNVLTLGSDYEDITGTVGFRLYLYNSEATGGSGGLQGPITITGTYLYTGPAIYTNPSSLTGLDYAIGNGPSESQAVAISGLNLTPADGSITVAASTNFKVSSDNITFGESVTLDYTTGELASTNIYVRLEEGLSAGTYTENVVLSGGGAANKNLSCTGKVEVPATTTIPYTETFEITLGDCYVYSVTGDSRFWEYNPSGFANMNGFGSSILEEDWLILPGIALNNEDIVLYFNSWKNFGTTNETNYLKLYYSTDYIGVGNPTGSTWTELPFTQPSANSTWTPSGKIDLSSIVGTNVYIGFKYHYNVGNYVSWSVDDINIREVVSATISPTTADYDLYNEQDIATTITWNDASSVTSVKHGLTSLTETTHYSISDNTLTIKKEYIQSILPAVEVDDELIFDINFNIGNNPTFTVTIIDNTPPPAVTFNVDMSNASSFDPLSDNIYISGTLNGWNEPGNADYKLLPIDVGSKIYTITLSLNAGDYSYKFFKNAGWDGGEWPGGDNRSVTITGDKIVNTVWGINGEPVIGWANLQSPDAGTIGVGGAFDVYSQIWIENVTSASAAPYEMVKVWVGYSNTDTDPSTWTNWLEATYDSKQGNNHEYKAEIGSGISSIGTYYYASRFQFANSTYYYGGYNSGAWDGTTNVSGVLTVIYTDEQKVAIDKAELGFEDFTFAGSETETTIKSNFTVPVLGEVHGSDISWASDNAAISISGANATVTRPLAGGKGTGVLPVDLTATITSGLASDTKVMQVSVLEDQSTFTPALEVEGDKTSGVAFNIDITDAVDADGVALAGDINVTVTTDQTGKAGAQVFNENATFTAGVAKITVTLNDVALHTLSIVVTGVTENQNLAVNVIAAAEYSISLAIDGTPVGATYQFAGAIAGYTPITAKSVTVTRTGTGDITNLAVALSGANAASFTKTNPVLTTLNDGNPSTTFTIKPNDGLAAGTYTATVTVTADNSVSESFNISFEVTPTYTITVAAVAGGGTADVTTTPATSTTATTVVTVDIANIQAGYRFKSIEVKDVDLGVVATTLVTAGVKYTFVMPAKNVTVTVTVEAIPAYTVTFAVEGGNGAINAKVDGAFISSASSVQETKNVVFTAIPIPSYKVKSWTVGTTVQPGETGNTFTYNNLQANISVKVEFEVIPNTDADLLLVENFDYAVGQLLTANGWTAHSGAGTNAVTVTAASINYPNYISSGIGNEVSLVATGEDVNKSFTEQNSGSVYVALIANITSASATADYFFHLGAKTMSTNFKARLFVKKDGSDKIAFGIAHTVSAEAVFTEFNYDLNTNYLIAVKYALVEGDKNDVVSIYINPVPGDSEPSTGWVSTVIEATQVDPSDIGTVALRQGTVGNAVNVKVDGIRVAKSWAEAVKRPVPPAATFTPAQGATSVALDVSPTISFDKAIRNIDNSEITNANVGSLLSLTKGGTENVAFTATINTEKTLITVDPTADLAKESNYTLAINPVEDANGYATLLQGVTFTTIPRSDVTTLSAFTLGGVNALTLQNVVVTNPTTDAGAMLFVANFTGFAGIVATPTDANATRTVKVNGVEVAPGDLATKPLAKDDVVLITVVAENTVATKYYKVTLTDQANSAAEILTYSIAGQVGDAVITPGTTAGTIAVTVPYGTDLTALVATFTLSDGATVKVGTTAQVSGTTANNFTNPVVYVVTAENTVATKNWTVTVTPEAGSSAADILTYSFAEQTGPATVNATDGTVAIEVAAGTNLTALVATFTLSDLATAKVGDVAQVSGTTPNNFTSPVTYVVTSQNGTTKNWTVTVTVQVLPATIFTETMGTVAATTSIAAHETANGFDNDNFTMTSGGITDPADVRATSTSTGYAGASGLANVFFTSTAGERGFAIEGINAANYTDLKLQFGYRKEDGSNLPTLAVDYWNGTAYVNVPFTFAEAANAASGWYLSPSIALPAAAQIDGLKLRWVKSGNVSVRIDDVKLTGYATPDVTAPTITFNPANDATDVLVNVTPTITFNEAVRNIDDSEITNTNVASLLTFKQGTTDVAFTAAINDAKKVITITPTAALENEKAYTVTIAPVEDANNNASTQQTATFTTISATTPVLDLTSTHAGPYYVGDNVTVTWTSANIDNVAVEMYTPSTETWAAVNTGAASVAATLGTYTFAIPATTPFGTAYKLRVKNAAAATPVEESGAFTIRLVVNTLAQLRALTANTEAKYTGTALVTYARPSAGRNQKYIQDASAAILIDDASGIITSEYLAGSKMTGLVGKISIYNAMVQLVPLADPGAAVSTGNPVVPTLTNLASLTSADQSKLVRIPSVEFTSTGTFASGQNYDIEDPSESKATGVFRTAFSEADYIGEAIPTETLNAMIALVGEFNGTIQLTSRNLADFIMPVADDATLFAFTVGGMDALSLDDVVVEDPDVDEGAILFVENFTNFKGIVATPNQNSATVSVSLNGSVVAVADLATQPIAEGDVIVVTVVAADGETTMYYKVTTEQAEVETFTVTFNVVDAEEVAITDAVITFAGETYDAGDYEITEVIPGTYSYKVSKVGYLSAYGSVEVVDADVTIDVTLVEGSAMSLPFSEDFEVEDPAETPDTYLPEGWLAIDSDGDEFNWYWGFRATDSNGSMRSESYDSATTDPLTPDNWLITPAIDMNTEETSITLSFKVAPTASTSAYRQEHYSVLISTTDTELESFETIYEETLETTATNWIYVEKKVDLTDYMGQIVYIAFRHHDVTDMDRITLDDVMVYAGGISADIQPIADIKVFPNPFRDYITIANASSVDRVVITNIIGQTVMNLRFDGVEGQINTSNLQRGIYLITFYSKNGDRVVRKMIKE